MRYFPMFVPLATVPCLVVGGGAVALRKTKKLISYGASVTAAAPQFIPEFYELERQEKVMLLSRVFLPEDLEHRKLVVAATDDKNVNSEVSRICRKHNIPVNVADDKELCSFIFPATVERGSLSIGISSGGASPNAAVYIKEKIEALLPKEEENFEEILDYLAKMRAEVKKNISEEVVRAEIFSDLFDLCMEKGRPLADEEYLELLRREENHGK